MGLYLGSNKVAGNTTSESLKNDLKNYKVTFDDSGTIGESENFTSIMGEIKSKGLMFGILCGVKKALNFLNNALENIQTTITGINGSLSQFNEALNNKSNTGHTHDDRYYTETEINNKLNGKANSSHTHDDRYFTESEINNKLNGKANSSHNHAELRDPNNKYRLSMQDDGNLVIYRISDGHAVWSASGTKWNP